MVSHEEIFLRAPTLRRLRLIIGDKKIAQAIARVIIQQQTQRSKKQVIIALDGYLGVDWQAVIFAVKQRLKKDGVNARIIDIASCYKAPRELKKIVAPFLSDDPLFGRVCNEPIETFLDEKKIRERIGEFKNNDVTILFGSGAANVYVEDILDSIFYFDITLEELIARTRKGMVAPLGVNVGLPEAGLKKNAPAYLSTKRFHYVDFPVLDRHKKQLLAKMDFYIDASIVAQPKLISTSIYRKLLAQLVEAPFRPRPHYDPAPWGGQWLKKVRNLPKDMVNAGWSYDLIAPDMAVDVPCGATFLQIPFLNILWAHPYELMGEYVTKRFHGEWPIRVNFDDTLDEKEQEFGMGIHVHPDTSYVKKHFNELAGQDESYYILATGPGAKVYLGLKEGADLEEFRAAAQRAETEGVPFNHEKYLNGFEAKQGDLFLIPTGTVHSGKNAVVLEISATTVRYTLRIYDYLRPDLNGNLRPISSHHAFRVIDPKKRTNWVKKHLIQKPTVVRSGKGWAEYCIGRLEGLFFRIHRLEFDKSVEDNTDSRFHLLTLVEGEGVRVVPRDHPRHSFMLGFSETVIVPASISAYSIINTGKQRCKVVKSFVS